MKKMNNSLTLLIFILIMISGTSFSQQANDKINVIEFKFSSPRRSVYSDVIITLTKIKTITGEVTVYARSYPMDIDENRKKASKIDTIFFIKDKKIFDDLLNEVVPVLNKIDLTRSSMEGNDGIWCTIEYGAYSGRLAYSFWSPYYETRQRGLTDYLNLCKKIIEIGGLNPKDILE
jgi:hypothetical protein